MKTIFAITLNNLRSIPARLGSSLVIVVGIAFVVAVLVSMLSMTRGFDKTLRGTGSEQRALLLSAGVLAEVQSYISPDTLAPVEGLPGVARNAEGQPMVSPELMIITELRKGSGPQAASVNVALRGINPVGIGMRHEMTIAEGRMFKAGLREVIAGVAASKQFEGVGVGKLLKFRGSEWTVVGLFSTDGDAHETELWTDLDTARGAFGRPGASSVLVQLNTPSDLDPLTKAIKADPRLQLDAQSEHAYFAAQSEAFSRNIGTVIGIVTFFMGLGALFGALNTMYSAVSTRQVEIATLRAIGFSALPVVVSVLAEALMLALAGGGIGAAIAKIAFDGMSVTTLGSNGSFTQVAFSFLVDRHLIVVGIVSAVSIGFLGGLLPALRAARLPIVDALRAS